MTPVPATHSGHSLPSSARPRTLSRRHHVVNRRLLMLTVMLLVSVVPIGYLWYRYQSRKVSNALLARAEQLEQEKDWSRASSYYQRYLHLAPEDSQTLVKLAQALSQLEPSPDRLNRLNSLLYRAIGRMEGRSDLRRMLAENLLAVGAFHEAEQEASKVLAQNNEISASPGDVAAAQKVVALARAARAPLDGSVSDRDAVQGLVLAARALPGDVELIEATAHALREHPTALETEQTDAATLADELMDQLVAVDPDNVSARLARSRYRTMYRLPDTEADLQAILRIEPNNIEALLLSATPNRSTEITDEQRARAEVLLRRAIEVDPRDPRPYLTLANLATRTGNEQEAIQWLELGREASDERSDQQLVWELDLASTAALIRAGKLIEAAEMLRQLEARSATYMVGLSNLARTGQENRLRLLRARLDLANGETSLAVSKLNAVLLSASGSPSNRRPAEWNEAARLMAQHHVRSGQWDLASEHLGVLAQQDPSNAEVTLKTAEAYVRAMNPSAAIRLLEESLSRLAEPSSELWIRLVEAHLAQQLSRPEPRNWAEFRRALATAKAKVTDRQELVFAEVAQVLAEADDRERALMLLREAEEKFHESEDYWEHAAMVYQQVNLQEEVDRALVRHRELTKSTADHAILAASLLARQSRYKEAEQLLVGHGASLSPEEGRKVERAHIAILVEANDFKRAVERAKHLIEANAEDAESLALGIDLALSAEDFSTAELWEIKLREVTGDGVDARYLRARRQLMSYDDLSQRERQDLTSALAALRSERPRWYPVIALSGRLAHRRGDTRRAMLDYQEALALGDRRTSTLRQLIELSYEQGRFDEAQAYLTQFTGDQPTTPYLDSLAIELAVKQEQLERAVQFAKSGVDGFPEDPLRRIMLAQLLLRLGQSQEAIQVLRTAAKKFRDDPRVWIALVTAHARSDQSEEARRILTALVSRDLLPKELRHVVAAQAYEILGDVEQAKRQYELAIAQQPHDIAIRLRHAKLLADSDPRSAINQYELILQQHPENREARQELAILLASTAHEADWTRAMQLLADAQETSAGTGKGGTTNDRLRALLLSRKGRTRAERLANCQAAREVLRRLGEIDTDESNDLNRLLTAQILEQEAALSGDPSLLLAARDELREVTHRGPLTADKLSRYIRFLLRHARTEPNPATEATSQAISDASLPEFKDEFLAEASAAIEDLQRLTSSNASQVAVLAVSLKAHLLRAKGLDEEAVAVITDYVTQSTEQNQAQPNQAQQYQTFGSLYQSIQSHAQAEKWFRRLTELNPNAYVLVIQSLVAQGKRNEAIEFCLSNSTGDPNAEVATLLASLLTVTDQPIEDLPDVRSAIEDAVSAHSENIELLQTQAVMRASRGEYDEAISIFRKIVEVDPDNAVALNNLATLLAEKPNQRAEALERIQQAIDLVGRKAALLDTQGTIYLKLGDAPQAIACLEEATAGGETDARYYLHLASAYQLANRDDDALSMLQEARAFGLERFVLTDDDRQLLTKLEEQFAVNTVPGKSSQ